MRQYLNCFPKTTQVGETYIKVSGSMMHKFYLSYFYITLDKLTIL